MPTHLPRHELNQRPKNECPAGYQTGWLSIHLHAQTSLVQWFSHSLLRVLALEILHFPLRMSECVTNPDVEQGEVTIWCAQRDQTVGNWDRESKYQSDCTRYIRELQEKCPWVGPLDLNIVAQKVIVPERYGCSYNSANGTRSTEQIHEIPKS